MKKTITINEIAKIANVSRGTVDRVVNNRGYVAEDKLKLIKQIIKDSNFTPNTHGRNLALSKTLKIAIILPIHSKGDYFESIVQASQLAGKNYMPFGLQLSYYQFDTNDLSKFSEIEKIIFNEDYNAIITTQPQNKTINSFLKKCIKKNIPYVLLGTIHNKFSSLSNLGQDAKQSGRLVGKLINYGQDKAAKYLAFNIYNENNINPNVINRIEGFKSYFKEKKIKKIKIEVINISINDSQLDLKIKENIKSLTTNDGVFVPNSRSYLIAKHLEKKQKIRFIGFDLVSKNISYLKAEIIDFLINQKPFEQGYKSVELLYRFLATHQEPLKNISIPVEVITIENLDFNDDQL
jgi:LacI family transcriptional regulator